MDLLIDVGNSRIKWAISQAGKLTAHGSAEHVGVVPVELNQVLQPGELPTRVIAANVAGDVYEQLLGDWVQRQWSLDVDYVEVDPDYSDIKLAYSDPHKFGVDRWLALIAARDLLSADVAVVDVGTAVTVDVMTAQGLHQGGIIIPGLSLMQQSLMQKSSAIQQELISQENAKSALLGRDTASGITSGSLYAVTGAIEHLLTKVVAQTGTRLSVIISGGDAEAVRAELRIESRHIPDLVLQGMKILKGACE